MPLARRGLGRQEHWAKASGRISRPALKDRLILKTATRWSFILNDFYKRKEKKLSMVIFKQQSSK